MGRGGAVVAVFTAEDGVEELTDEELGPWLISHRRRLDQSESSWLLALADFDDKCLWARDGQLSCKTWLRWKLNMGTSTAYEKLHVSHELRSRPILAEAFAAGRISYSAARAISHMEDPDPETDQALVRLAEERNVRQVEFAVRHYNQIKDQERPPAEPEPCRCIRVRPLGGGNSRVEWTGPDLEVQEFMKALEATAAVRRRSGRRKDGARSSQRAGTPSNGTDPASSDGCEGGAQSSREDDAGVPGGVDGGEAGTAGRSPEPGDPGAAIAGPSADSSREDDAGVPGGVDGGEAGRAGRSPEPGDPGAAVAGPSADSSREDDAGEDAAQRHWKISRAEAVIDLARLALAHADDGHAAGDDRYMIHLVGRDGQLTGLDGTPIDPEVAAGVACDTSIVAHTVDDHGEPLHVGRKTKEWTTAQRRAITVRDGGRCRWPGCERRIIDIHHRVFWSNGGLTDVDNGLCACRRHHRLLHHGFSTEAREDGAVDFLRPDGTVLGTTYPAHRQLSFAA
jgi:hypothetical protein